MSLSLSSATTDAAAAAVELQKEAKSPRWRVLQRHDFTNNFGVEVVAA